MKKIRINRNELIKTLTVSGVMAGKSKTIPILDNVKCVADENGMTITSFNEQVAVTSRCPLVEALDEKIEFCIEPRELLDFLRLITTEENVELELNDNLTMATINHAHGDMSFATFGAEDFPILSREEVNSKLEIECEVLTDWIRSSSKFCSADSLKPVIKSMYLYAKDGECGYCATDTQMLITDSYECDEKDVDADAIIPSSAFDAILGIMEKGSSVSIKIGEKNVVFRCGNSAVKALVAEGRYPDFKRIIPNGTPIKVENLSSSLFLDSVLRTALVKNSRMSTDKRIKMTLEPNMLTLDALNLMNGKKSTENIMCQCVDSLEIGFNCDYLRDVLSCVSTETISLNLTDAKHAMIIKEAENDRKVMLLMPNILKK